jgi:hypothetical protein
LALQQELKDTQKALRALQVERETERKELEKLKGSLEHERCRLIGDKARLDRELAGKTVEVDRLNEENMKLRSELLAAKLASRGVTDSAGQVRALEEMLKQSFESRDEVRRHFEDLAEISKELTGQISSLEANQRTEVGALHKTAESLRDQLASEKQTARSLQLKEGEQETHIATLEELACVQEDFASLREDLMQQVSMTDWSSWRLLVSWMQWPTTASCKLSTTRLKATS